MRASRACLLAALLSLAPAGAAAQPADGSQRALTLAYEGDDLYARARWADAYDRFAEADKLAHSPVFVLYMARCRKNAGHLLEAKSIYQRVAGESLAQSAPKPFRQAVADAATERDELAARIPTLTVVVTGGPATDAIVRVDDQVVTAGKAVPLDPAPHHVTASAGSKRVEKTVTLAEGDRAVRVELSFATAPAPAEPERKGSLAPAVVALSFGIVGVGIGAVTGGMAASKTSDIKETCNDDGHCASGSAGDLDSARGLATTSTVGFIAGGVGLAAALVLFIVRPGGAGAPSPTASKAARGRLLLGGSF